MMARLTALLAALLLLASANQALSRPQATTIGLTYTMKYGGLKTVVPPKEINMPKLGLALAGGGARAAAAVGVLRVLDEAGIPVSFIAGTSMGAGVGGMYAAGYTPDEIEQMFIDNDWNDIFTDRPARAFLTQAQKEAGSRYLLEFTFHRGRFQPPTGLTTGQKLTNLLAAKTLAASFEADLDFNRLPVPFRAVATDIETGDEVVISHGLLHDAIRASMAVPLVFQPVPLQGRLLVDGGLVDNLPVSVVRSMGADVVIAVDSAKKLENRDKLKSLIDIMSQAISLQIHRESERQAAQADLVITPDTEAFSFAGFPEIEGIVAKGVEAGRAALPRIRELLREKAPALARTEKYRIARLVIEGNEAVPENDIRSAMMPLLSRRSATAEDIREALADVYRIGSFSDVNIELLPEGDGARAVLRVEENPVVGTIEVSGNTIVPTKDFLEALQWQEGRPLNVTRLTAVLDGIVASCRSRGYLLTKVEHAGVEPGGALKIVMYEGRVDAITITGQRRTRMSLIKRETKTRPGSPLNFNQAEADIQHLYAMDYFESLNLDITKSPTGGVDLRLHIDEKPVTRVRLGLRYDLEDRFTGLTDIVVDSVSGRGIKMYLNTQYGNYTDLTAGYYSPVLLNTYFVHRVQAFYRDRDYYLYQDKHRVDELNVTRTGAEVAFGYQWFRFGDTYLRYRYAEERVEETLGVNPSRSTEHIGSLAFLSTLDTRDKAVFPHTGVLFKGSYELARPAFGSTNDFTRTSLYGQENIPLAENHTLVLEASAGLGSGTLPFAEQFGIGGADYLISIPLLGYQRREFIGSNELGYAAAYRWRIKEYQLKAVRAVYLNLAYQAANVWDRQGSITLNDLKSGMGAGIHADTLIGPFRLDFGWGEQHRYAVYFSAGFDF